MKIFYRKMAAYTQDEWLLIYCFQESLTSDTLKWYDELDSTAIISWEALYDTFMHQCRHNTNMAPTQS